MPTYDFELEDGSVSTVRVPAAEVDAWHSERALGGGWYRLDDGKAGKKLIGSLLSCHFGKNHAPSHDAERAESVRAFHEPCAFAKGKSMAEYVKENNLKTMGDSRWL